MKRGSGQKRPFPGDANDTFGLHKACMDFLEHIRVRHYSPRTISGFQDSLAIFVTWCEQRGIVRPTDVSRPVLEAYQRHLFWRRKSDGTPLSNQTQYGRLVPIRGLFRYLVKNNRILANPASDLELPKVDQKLPRAVLSIAEAEAVLNVPDTNDPYGIRDRAILEVLYSTGIRRSEAIALTVWDTDNERGLITVRKGKGRKDRIVPISARALAWVSRYATEVRPSLIVEPDSGVLFLTKEGMDLTPDHLSGLVARYVDRSSVDKRGSCHMFRHTMATLMLEGGADIRYVQQMLGHVDINTTTIYTQVAVGTLKAIHDATHPGAVEGTRANAAMSAVGIDVEAETQALLDQLDVEAMNETGEE